MLTKASLEDPHVSWLEDACRHCSSCYCFRARGHCFCCLFYCTLKGFHAIRARPYDRRPKRRPKRGEGGGKGKTSEARVDRGWKDRGRGRLQGSFWFLHSAL